MADSKLTNLSATAAPALTDLMYLVVDPAGTPLDRKLTLANLKALVVPSGNAFPGSPSSGDRFYRSDRNIEYFYDGTRWLSTQQFHLALTPHTAFSNVTVTNTTLMRANNPVAGLYDIWAMYASFTWNYSVSAGWTLNLSKLDVTTITSIATHTPAFADTSWYSTRVTIDAVVASSVDMFVGGATENSGAAEFTMAMSLVYRLIG